MHRLRFAILALALALTPGITLANPFASPPSTIWAPPLTSAQGSYQLPLDDLLPPPPPSPPWIPCLSDGNADPSCTSEFPSDTEELNGPPLFLCDDGEEWDLLHQRCRRVEDSSTAVE